MWLFNQLCPVLKMLILFSSETIIKQTICGFNNTQHNTRVATSIQAQSLIYVSAYNDRSIIDRERERAAMVRIKP
jgi:hypothetical protein